MRRYYRLSKGEHVALPEPPPVAELLARALRPGVAERPDLATFTRALAALAARYERQ